MTNRGMAHVHGATRSAEGVPKQPRVSMFQWRRYQRIRIVAELARCSKNGEFRFLFCVVLRQGRERKKERKGRKTRGWSRIAHFKDLKFWSTFDWASKLLEERFIRIAVVQKNWNKFNLEKFVDKINCFNSLRHCMIEEWRIELASPHLFQLDNLGWRTHIG